MSGHKRRRCPAVDAAVGLDSSFSWPGGCPPGASTPQAGPPTFHPPRIPGRTTFARNPVDYVCHAQRRQPASRTSSSGAHAWVFGANLAIRSPPPASSIRPVSHHPNRFGWPPLSRPNPPKAGWRGCGLARRDRPSDSWSRAYRAYQDRGGNPSLPRKASCHGRRHSGSGRTGEVCDTG